MEEGERCGLAAEQDARSFDCERCAFFALDDRQTAGCHVAALLAMTRERDGRGESVAGWPRSKMYEILRLRSRVLRAGMTIFACGSRTAGCHVAALLAMTREGDGGVRALRAGRGARRKILRLRTLSRSSRWMTGFACGSRYSRLPRRCAPRNDKREEWKRESVAGWPRGKTQDPSAAKAFAFFAQDDNLRSLGQQVATSLRSSQ